MFSVLKYSSEIGILFSEIKFTFSEIEITFSEIEFTFSEIEFTFSEIEFAFSEIMFTFSEIEIEKNSTGNTTQNVILTFNKRLYSTVQLAKSVRNAGM